MLSLLVGGAVPPDKSGKIGLLCEINIRKKDKKCKNHDAVREIFTNFTENK